MVSWSLTSREELQARTASPVVVGGVPGDTLADAELTARRVPNETSRLLTEARRIQRTARFYTTTSQQTQTNQSMKL